jgi:hypothetical protein
MKIFFTIVACALILIVANGYGQIGATNPKAATHQIVPLSKSATSATVSQKLSYQGLLTTSGGAPVVDGLYDLKFEMFNVSTSGGALWSETQTGVTVSHGTFSVLLGAVTPLVSIFYQPLWLEVTAVSGPGLSGSITFAPRAELASAAYSLGPWQSSDYGYYTQYGSIGIGAQPSFPWVSYGRSVQLVDSSSGSAWYLAKSFNNYAGFAADKPFAEYNAYLVLLTSGEWRWTVGSMGSNDFNVYDWHSYMDRFHIDTLGNVGIGITSPTTKLDVNGPLHVLDTVKIGSSDTSGYLNLYHSGFSNPILRAYPLSSFGVGIDLFDESGSFTHTIEADISGSGGYFSVYRDAGSPGFTVDGNYGGTLQPRVSITGANRSATFNMSQTANASVVLPDSSISSVEMFDEPGVAGKFSSGASIPSLSTNYRIDSITINVPAAGKVIVDAHGWINVTHTNGTSDNVAVHVFTDPTDYVYTYGASSMTIPAECPTSSLGYRQTLSCKNIFDVSSATTLKVYLVGYRATGGSTYVMDPFICATYYPTVYGSTPVSVTNTTNRDDGNSTDMGSGNVTYQSADDFNAQKAEAFKVELEQLKMKIQSLEKQLDGSQQNDPYQR